MSMYRWEIGVRQLDHYGEKFISETPMSVTAATKSEVTEKVRVAFGATYDSFRKFWSHTWVLKSVAEELTPTTNPANTPPATDEEK